MSRTARRPASSSPAGTSSRIRRAGILESTLVSSLLALLFTLPAHADCPGTPGDLAPGVLDTSGSRPVFVVTGNGRLDIADVVEALRGSVGLQDIAWDDPQDNCSPVPGDVSPGLQVGNVFRVTGDGVLNIGDVVALLRGSVGLQVLVENAGPIPAAPVLSPLTMATTDPDVLVSGLADPEVTVRIEGGGLTVETTSDGDGSFEITVPLKSNSLNRLLVTAIDAAGRVSPSTAAQVVQDGQAPFVFVDFPIDGAETITETIDVAGRVGDTLSGFLDLTVDVAGGPAAVDVGQGTNGSFVRLGVPLAVGPNPIRVTATDVLGNVATVDLTVTRVVPDGPAVGVVSGNGKIGTVNMPLPEPVVVNLADETGVPIAGKIATFTVTKSDGMLQEMEADGGARPLKRTVQVVTDADGNAMVQWTLGSDAGCGNNLLTVESTDLAGKLTVCASAMAAAPSQVNVGTGNYQRGEVGAVLPEALRVWVNDGCNGVEGVPVTFTVEQGGGRIDGMSQVTVPTGLTGHAEVSFELGPEPGNNLVRATFAGNEGMPATFLLLGLARAANATTSLSGLVIDNAGRPIGGAPCHLEVGDDDWNTTSDAEGRFLFEDVLAGPAELTVEGLTATLLAGEPIPLASFPDLHYELVIVPAVANSLPRPVLLPPLDPANAVMYDGTTDVELTVAGIDGLTMTVAAGSMRRADGSLPTPGDPAIVSLNQVHDDDIPMPLPDGAAAPFAWTLQPAGATFDPPVTISYPNMSGLAPGSVAYFLSFDHGQGRFVIVASATVSDDGARIVSDPGTGISEAGWGGACPPYVVTTEVVSKGACCLPSGACFLTTEEACTMGGNTWAGGTSCGEETCPMPETGACCLPNGSCVDGQTMFSCATQGGTFQGPGVGCAPAMPGGEGPCPGDCMVDGEVTTIASVDFDFSDILSSVEGRLNTIPRVTASGFELTAGIAGLEGMECCTADGDPTAYLQLTGAADAAGTIDIALTPFAADFDATWEGYGSVDVDITIGPTVTLRPAFAVSASGRDGECPCVTLSGDASIGITATYGGEVAVTLMINRTWLWDDFSVGLGATATASISTTACAGGDYLIGDECPAPPGTGFQNGTAGIGGVSTVATLAFTVAGLEYETSTGDIEIIEAFGSGCP
ncbi:MAG: Ig-like domain-containing protein [Acidobacteriota bacterium]